MSNIFEENPQAETKKIDSEFQRKMKAMAMRFSALRVSYNILRRRARLQTGKECDIPVIAQIHLAGEQIDKAQEAVERAIAALDSQGYWTLSEEDKERIETDYEANQILEKFLPQMIRYKLSDDKTKDISRYCYIL